jgi:hypothetical protein
MADLTEEELEIIEQNPLGDSLNAIREALCKAQQFGSIVFLNQKRVRRELSALEMKDFEPHT